MTSLFQKKVYKVVKKIPKGKTLTYKKVAQLAGHPKAWRAVGNILRRSAELSRSHKNRDKKIPCHRIICSDGRVGGYRQGTKKKILLLKKEGVKIKNSKVEKCFLEP